MILSQHIHKWPEPNLFIVSSQGTKYNHDKEEKGKEYNADQTIIGGKNTIGL